MLGCPFVWLFAYVTVLVQYLANGLTSYITSRLHPLILLGGYQSNKLLPLSNVFDRPDFDNTTQVMYFDLGEDVSTIDMVYESSTVFNMFVDPLPDLTKFLRNW